MSEIYKDMLLSVAKVALIVVIAFNAGHRHALNRLVLPQNERVDTLYVCDTITQYKPILEERVVLQKVPVPVVDTIWVHDTMYVYLEREQVVWQDSLSCVYVSGILPQVDSVEHYIRERVVTRELTQVVKKPCKWGIGVHAGYGVFVNNGQFATSPYVGIGISYNLWSW